MKADRWSLTHLACAATVFSLLIATTAHALPDDQQQPIRITADSAERDENASTTRYVGSVVLTQGSLVIEADTLVIKQLERDQSVITASGTPARMRQTPELEQPPIKAEAGEIIYRQQQDQITLSDGARIEQDGAIVTGAVIDYQVSAQRVSASGGDEGTGQRVEVIIPPKAIEES